MHWALVPEDGGTRIEIDFEYALPKSWFGRALCRLLGGRYASRSWLLTAQISDRSRASSRRSARASPGTVPATYPSPHIPRAFRSACPERMTRAVSRIPRSLLRIVPYGCRSSCRPFPRSKRSRRRWRRPFQATRLSEIPARFLLATAHRDSVSLRTIRGIPLPSVKLVTPRNFHQ